MSVVISEGIFDPRIFDPRLFDTERRLYIEDNYQVTSDHPFTANTQITKTRSPGAP